MKKTVTVVSNDPKRPQLLLTVAGSVEVFADIQPERIILRGNSGQPMRQELVVKPRASYPFKVTEISAKNGVNIQYEMKEQETPEGKSYVVTVENTKTSPGKYYDTLFLSTDNPLKPKIPIHVYGTIATGRGNPLAGKRAFTGNSRGWAKARLDLSRFAGSSVKVRFRMGSDRKVGGRGWYVDDIRIYNRVVKP